MIDSALFAKVTIFSELDPPHLDALSRVATTRVYAAGEAILREDEPGDLFFVIVRGQVKVFVDSEHGREVVLTHLKAGDFFGEMALFDNETRSASVSALVASELVVLRRQDFLEVLADDFTIARRILSTLSGRLRRANDMIESLVLLDVGGRLARYLLGLAVDSGALGEDGWYTVSRPTHQVIANSIGASRETVTRLLRQFAERGLIRMRGSTVWIRDEPLRTTPAGTRKAADQILTPSTPETGKKGETPRRR
ncbi:MAG: Crp/Fnr family transcriptional regulator [Acidobacteria bacterium]|nr:MAG: Crp/Fnr family transcriptional regulator [Acidobacteriota bacterium]